MRRFRIASRKLSLRFRSGLASAVIGPIVIHGYRRVVGKAFISIDRRAFDLVLEAGCYDLIVESPPDIVIPGTTAIRPPGVLVGLLRKGAKCISPFVLAKHLVQPRSLFRKKTRVFLIALPVLEVYFLVRDIPVATNDVFRSPPLQFLKVFSE